MNQAYTDPSLPFFVVRHHDAAMFSTQDAEEARDAARRYGKKYTRIQVVPAEWRDTKQCLRTDVHAKHTWGGPGWSPFACAGVA